MSDIEELYLDVRPGGVTHDLPTDLWRLESKSKLGSYKKVLEEIEEKEEKFFNTKAFWIAVAIGIVTGLILALLTAQWWLVWYLNWLAN